MFRSRRRRLIFWYQYKRLVTHKEPEFAISEQTSALVEKYFLHVFRRYSVGDPSFSARAQCPMTTARPSAVAQSEAVISQRCGRPTFLNPLMSCDPTVLRSVQLQLCMCTQIIFDAKHPRRLHHMGHLLVLLHQRHFCNTQSPAPECLLTQHSRENPFGVGNLH